MWGVGDDLQHRVMVEPATAAIRAESSLHGGRLYRWAKQRPLQAFYIAGNSTCHSR